MKAPDFWYKPAKNLLAKLLSPIGLLIYHFGKKRFKNISGYNGKTPIICIGNATAGGTGKTPTAIYIARKIKEMQLKPVFVTKGYGGTLTGPVFAEDQYSYKETGDEAQLLKCHAPTIIAKDRIAGVTLANQKNYDVIILDDGLQNHPSLYNKSYGKRLTLMTVDRMRGFGNKALIPAGPLREPLESAFKKTDAFIVLGDNKYPLPDSLKETEKPVCHAIREPLIHGEEFSGQKVIAFAGIGNPEQFFKMLEKLGCDLIQKEAFPDHYAFPSQIIKRLMRDAEKNDALLVTTEKDMVRIDPCYYAYMRPFLTNIVLSDQDENILCTHIEKLLQQDNIIE